MWRAEEMVDIIEYRGPTSWGDGLWKEMSSMAKAVSRNVGKTYVRAGHAWAGAGTEYKVIEKSRMACIPGMDKKLVNAFSIIIKAGEQWEEVHTHFKTDSNIHKVIKQLDQANQHILDLKKSYEMLQHKVHKPVNCLTVEDARNFHDSFDKVHSVFKEMKKVFDPKFFQGSDFKNIMDLFGLIVKHPDQWSTFNDLEFGHTIPKQCKEQLKRALPHMSDCNETPWKKHWEENNTEDFFIDKARSKLRAPERGDHSKEEYATLKKQFEEKVTTKAREKRNGALDKAWTKNLTLVEHKLKMLGDFLGIKVSGNPVDYRKTLEKKIDGLVLGEYLRRYSYYNMRTGKDGHKRKYKRLPFGACEKRVPKKNTPSEQGKK
tara:strand:+ start:1164 stop:2288 length:1125 start_codon:yes stop_codon:yes gene_type:complete